MRIEIEKLWEQENMLAFGAHAAADDEGIVFAVALIAWGVQLYIDWPGA